jgi:hypothetical protein
VDDIRGVEVKFAIGFWNGSTSEQDWSLFLDDVSVATMKLKSQTGSGKYVNIELDDGKDVQVTVGATGNAAAKLTRKGDKLVISSFTPKEWELEQETGTQYVLKCTLA